VRAARTVAALLLVAVLAACGGSAKAGGTGQFGAADPASPATSASPGVDPTAEAGFTFSPSPTPAGSGSGDQGAGDLRATYKVDKTLLGAKATVTVTLTNKGTGDVNGWTVIMAISGVTLAVCFRGVGGCQAGPGLTIVDWMQCFLGLRPPPRQDRVRRAPRPRVPGRSARLRATPSGAR